MKYIDIPKLGKVARISLGCDHYGETIDEKIATEQLDYYIAQGGNLLDTARLYGQQVDEGPGTSEILLGQYLKHVDRSKLIIATKGGHPHLGHMDRPRLDRSSLYSDIEASLDQLGTPVDIYFLHRDWPEYEVGPIVETLNEFVQKGYTRILGASNWSTERIKEANMYAQKHNLQGFEFSELQYSLAKTDTETWGDSTIEIMGSSSSPKSFYEETMLPYMCFTSQGKGIFSKVIRGKECEMSERGRKRFLTDENRKRIERVRILTEKLSVSPEEIVISYITSQKSNAIAIIGSSKLEQIKTSLENTDLTLSQEMLDYLENGTTISL